MPRELLKRLDHVRATDLSAHAERFRQLASQGQRPSVLFVSCSDSRIVPNLLTGAGPGELFIVRTVGNIVAPLAGADGGPPGGDPTAAALEFAVGVLGVRDVVVCGHTGCGAMAALYDGVPADCKELGAWLEHARPAALPAERLDGLARQERDRLTAERNVLLSLDRLAADPVVATRRDEGALDLHGWMLDLGTQEVRVFDSAARDFVRVRP